MGRRAAAAYAAAQATRQAVADAGAAAASPADDDSLDGLDAESRALLAGGEAVEAGDDAADTGAAASPPASRPRVRVQVGNRVVEMDAEDAAALEAERRRQLLELDALRRPAAPAPAAPTPDPELRRPQRPDPNLAQVDWAEYSRQMAAYEEARDLWVEGRLERRYRAEQAAERQRQATAQAGESQRRELDGFLGRLRTTHPVLADEDDLILGAMHRVAARNPGVRLLLSDPATQQLVADEALRKLTAQAEKGRNLAPRPPRLEGQQGRVGGGRAEPAPKPTPPASLSEFMRERKQRRRAATTGGTRKAS